MRKIKILGIAPYEGIKVLMQQTAAGREDIELDVFIGDMDAGAAIASRYAPDDLDVIISRGGTAELIRRRTAFPVVDIPLSVYDIFRSIKLAENYTSKYALVGFPAITKNAHFLCDMLQYSIDIYTIHNEEEADRTLRELLDAGCRMVLCDMITNSLAKRYGMTSILIASGAESLETAFDSAVQIARSHKVLKTELAFYRYLLENNPWDTVVFLEDGEQLYSSRIDSLPDTVIQAMRANIPAVCESGEKKIYREHAGLLYVLQGRSSRFEEKTLLFYSVNSRKVPLALTKNGIRYITKEEAMDVFFGSFYGITHSTAALGVSIERFSDSDAPLVILGEVGTGKEPLARLIYAKGRLQDKPMAIIDCARIGARGWSFLTEHNNSPLSDTGTTIYVKNTSALSDGQFAELVSIISDLNLPSKNRMIFTFRYDADGAIPARCRKVQDSFSCLTLEIPAMRSHLTDMPNLISLYISSLNLRLAKEVVGIEADGIHALQSYDWPGNFDQFQRVMNELVAAADSPYIRTASVVRLLKREQPAKAALSGLNLNRTLEEINLDILRQVLSEERGNQSSTAKRLGISRTTLWRMLQKLDMK